MKGNQTSTTLEVELIERPGLWADWRFTLRFNDREPNQIKDHVDRGFRPVETMAREAKVTGAGNPRIGAWIRSKCHGSLQAESLAHLYSDAPGTSRTAAARSTGI